MSTNNQTLAFMDTSLKHLLSETLSQCNSHNIPTCLGYGTLLGFIRDGKIIPYDDDIDLLVHRKYRTALEKLSMELKKTKSALRMFPRKNMIRLVYDDPITMQVVCGDIFYYNKKDSEIGPVAMVTQENESFPWKYMSPLKPVNMYGVATNIPNNTHEWLQLQYGKDYMTPMQSNKGRMSTAYHIKQGLRHPLECISLYWKQYSLKYPHLGKTVLVVCILIASIVALRVAYKKHKL